MRWVLATGLFALAFWLPGWGMKRAYAQREPGESALGPPIGASGAVGAEAPGGEEPFFGGRPGPAFPRVPVESTRPGRGPFGIPEPEEFLPPPLVPGAELPLYGTLELPDVAEEEGPPDGLTLDEALERLVWFNLDLRAMALEIPQAQADILTAGLRDNPVLFFDTQFIPYQRFTEERPGGPTQYDLNITLPIDWNQKRRLRAEVATRAKRVLEAQYQDAVRLQIDNLYAVFVDIVAARETVRFAQASLEGLGRILEVTEAMLRAGEITPGDLRRMEIQVEAARIGLFEAEETYRDAKRPLAPLLNLPMEHAEAIEIRGTLSGLGVDLPPTEVLLQTALAVRPDLVAYRLGLQRAEADVRLARAERYSDIYLLVQPYTFQDLSPFGARSAHSGALGVTIPLPISNRNQGNIRRAEINVVQTQTELSALEQLVVTEVRRAERRYLLTLNTVRRIERELLPSALQVRDESFRRFREGEASLVEYLNAQREYNDLVRQYRDTLVQHRLSMLELNTAVGHRILP